jgi:hypothetical protein
MTSNGATLGVLLLLLGAARPSFGADAAPAQQVDPEAPVPPHRAAAVAPSVAGPRTSEAALIAGEVALGTVTASAIGVAGAYAFVYQPPQFDSAIPRTTAGSTALNLVGLTALLAGPLVAAKLVCGVGRWSSEYEGGCGGAIGLAYVVGAAAALAADAATTHPPPASCDDCPYTGPSFAPVVIAYVVGVSVGAIVGWNLSKHRKDGGLALLLF